MEKSSKGLLKRSQQDRISEQRRMPVDNVSSDTSTVISGETVQLNYWNAGGDLTVDAGQAVGVRVIAKLAQRNIKNAIGDVTGTFKDSSLSFTSTALTEEVAFPYLKAELYDDQSGKEKSEVITAGFANGQYCVDYRTGTIYGAKASTQTTLTATTYKIEMSASGAPSGLTENVNVSKVGGVAITDTNPMPTKVVAAVNTVGMSTVFDADADNSAQVVKASAGNLYYVTAINTNAADAYIQFFDVAAGSVNVGTTVPKFVLPVLGEAAYDGGFTVPMTFGTAITYACTTTPTGAGDPTVGLKVSFGYK